MARKRSGSTKSARSTEAEPVAAKLSEDLARGYFESVREVQADVQRDAETAVRKLTSVTSDVQDRLRDDVAKVVAAYIDALKGASGQPDALRRVEQAYLDYVSGLQAAHAKAGGRVEDALRDYAAVVLEVPRAARARGETAYREFVTEMQAALAGVEVDGLAADDVAVIGRNMLSVALANQAAGVR